MRLARGRYSIEIEKQPRHAVVALDPHDLWAGVYWKYERTLKEMLETYPDWPDRRIVSLFICPLPMLLVAFRISFKRQRGRLWGDVPEHPHCRSAVALFQGPWHPQTDLLAYLGRKEPMTTPSLNPCPFCGSATAPAAGRTRVWWVTCETEDGGCGAEGPHSFRTRREASEAWNKRPLTTIGPPPSGRMDEAIVELVTLLTVYIAQHSAKAGRRRQQHESALDGAISKVRALLKRVGG